MRSKFRRKIQKSKQNKNEDFALQLFDKLEDNITNIKNMLDHPDDLVIRDLIIGEAEHRCAVIYIDGIVNTDTIQNNVLAKLQKTDENKSQLGGPKKLFDYIFNEKLSINHIEKGKSMDDVSLALLTGHTIFYLDGINQAILIETKGGEYRGIEEPVSETLIRGPREGFIENLGTNLAIIRRNIAEPNLRLQAYKTGRRSKKNLVVAYIDGIVHPDLVKEVNRRLKTIDIDGAADTGYIEEWIEDSFLSPFPQMLNTERPDKVIAAMMQGKVGVFLDGTPVVLILPINFGNALQSPEDYYERWTIGSLLRVIRYLGAFISIFLPSLYIALISYHPGMIPSDLAFSIAASREGVPFPAAIEAVLMVITMELLQEAGARLPQTIGQTIGIVGGLVIGEAAVQAGIVSPIMVIVVALTAIATFAVPSYSVAISFRIVRFGFIFAAGVLGLYGIILVYIMINIHFVNLKSFGIPYSVPFAPFIAVDWKDLIIRSPIPTIKKRPVYLKTEDPNRLRKRRRN
ncbi:spore germination protein [Virgibacillus sp. W0181]|uniref:spore germination protein n=1 Tax=Virgibacillus sp. W0181 TaxID=3391581 RepID=UPI003F4805FD